MEVGPGALPIIWALTAFMKILDCHVETDARNRLSVSANQSAVHTFGRMASAVTGTYIHSLISPA